jgi:hypothetical protein
VLPVKLIFCSRPFLASLFVLLFTGCVNLKQINNYSENATESLTKYNDLDYSFSHACRQKCVITQLEENRLEARRCSCENEQQADSVARVIHGALRAYFSALAAVSDEDLTNYNFSSVKKSLHETQIGDLVITKEQSESYSKISAAITRLITDGVRKKKLAGFIAEGNAPVQTLLTTLRSILNSNLSKRLDTYRERVESFYFDLSIDSAASLYEKKQIIEEYHERIAAIESKQRLIRSYANGLTAIGKGHQALYDNRNQLNKEQIKSMFSEYSAGLKEIIDEFNQLKNDD